MPGRFTPLDKLGENMYYVYVLQSEKDRKIYVGFTKNLEERLKLHNNGKVKSTKNRLPLKLVYEV